MTKSSILRIAASTLVIGVATSGCTSLDLTKLQPASHDARVAQSAGDAAEKYARAAEKGDADKAIRYAEAAVAADPGNGEYRAMLGRAYVNAGRFASAETALADAMDLGHINGRTVVSLALAQVSNGKPAQALGTLDANRAIVNDSDYGLALTLMGRSDEAILILAGAARQVGATAQTRQNLAFALASAGRWLEAKLIAAQDMNVANLDERMTQWSTILQTAAPQQRVAGLFGITPVGADPGLPVRLALVDAPGAQAALASEAVQQLAADLPAYETAQPVSELAQVELAQVTPPPAPIVSVPVAPVAPPPVQTAVAPKPVQLDIAALPAEEAEPVLVKAASQPDYRNEVAQIIEAVEESAPVVPAKKTQPRKAAPTQVATTGWAVQLGAFGDTANAKSAWERYSRKYPALSSYGAISHIGVVDGKTWHRLSATGLGSRGEANRVCAAVKAKGGACFVRSLNGKESVRWASNGQQTKLASR